MRNKITINPNNLVSIEKQIKSSLDNQLNLIRNEIKLPEIYLSPLFLQENVALQRIHKI
jgi:hypothetical protein